MTLRNLIKMKCCLVCVTGGVTGLLLVFGHNRINSGITGTIALVYGIALVLLVSIAIHDKLVNQRGAGCAPGARPPGDPLR